LKKDITKNKINKLSNDNKNKLLNVFGNRNGYHEIKNYNLQRALIDSNSFFSNNGNIGINNLPTNIRSNKNV
jgi:hypothetical protein